MALYKVTKPGHMTFTVMAFGEDVPGHFKERFGGDITFVETIDPADLAAFNAKTKTQLDAEMAPFTAS